MQAEFVLSAYEGFSRADPAISCLDYDRRPFVRMRNADVIELFDLVDEGTPVIIEA